MGAARLTTALALLLALGALLYALPHGPAGEATAAASYPVAVTGPDGHALFNGTVQAANATAFSVLQATGLALQVDTYPAFGPGCGGVYVSGIGPYHASGASGWVYRVHVASQGAWVFGSSSSACFALHPGDRVEWSWGHA